MSRFNKESGRRAGIRSQQVQAERKLAGPMPVYPPMWTDLLMTDRVTDELAGRSVAYEIHQGRRQNGIEVFSFGRRLPSVTTWTKFYDLRRRRMATKWLTAP